MPNRDTTVNNILTKNGKILIHEIESFEKHAHVSKFVDQKGKTAHNPEKAADQFWENYQKQQTTEEEEWEQLKKKMIIKLKTKMNEKEKHEKIH